MTVGGKNLCPIKGTRGTGYEGFGTAQGAKTFAPNRCPKIFTPMCTLIEYPDSCEEKNEYYVDEYDGRDRTSHHHTDLTEIAMNGKTLVTALFLSLLGFNIQAQEKSAGITWLDINTALAEVGKSDKKILIDCYTDWCGWCKRMDRDTYADSSVAAYMNEHFLAVKFNPEKGDSVVYDGETYSARQFAAAWQVRGYPATGFVNEQSEVLTLMPGYKDPKSFLLILRFFGGDHHLTTTFQDFITAQNTATEGSGTSEE